MSVCLFWECTFTCLRLESLRTASVLSTHHIRCACLFIQFTLTASLHLVPFIKIIFLFYYNAPGEERCKNIWGNWLKLKCWFQFHCFHVSSCVPGFTSAKGFSWSVRARETCGCDASVTTLCSFRVTTWTERRAEPPETLFTKSTPALTSR